MRLIILILLIAIIAISCTQNAGRPKLSNKKYVNIPGTHIQIISPDSFSVATNFIGLKNSKGSQLLVTEIPDGNFYESSSNMNKNEFEKRGIKVFEFKELTIDGFPAKYVHMQGDDPRVNFYNLAFGDSTFSVMIMSMFPTKEQSVGNSLKHSILSIKYDKKLKIDPLATAIFTIDEKLTRFKFALYTANSYLYTINGKKIEENSEPKIMVGNVPVDFAMTPEVIANELILSLEKYGLKNGNIKKKSSKKINGYDAVELEIFGDIDEIRTLVYLLVLVNIDQAIYLTGYAKSDYDSNLSEFKKLAHTLKFK